MITLAAREAKNNFGHMLDMAQKEPVTIEKKGRPVAVVMSLDDYKHYEEIEDRIWALKVQQASEEGYLSHEESETLLIEIGRD